MYVYGPVPSRRLGRSLGVSPIPPKTCTYSCVYCQLGRTDDLRIERASFYPREEILAEVEDGARGVELDYITFVGDGEPTLCSDLGWLLHQTRTRLKRKTAVITNGSLLFRDDVRRDLAEADVVVPSLDAGTEATFRIINRPHGKLDFAEIVRGLQDFRREFHGEFWLEVMLVAGLNEQGEELAAIKETIETIHPDRVYIVTPTRPPAESWVHPPDSVTLLKAHEAIAGSVLIMEVESGEFGLHGFDSAAQAIAEIGSRHPLRWEQVKGIEAHFGETGTGERMLHSGELVEAEYVGKTYLLPKNIIERRQDPD